MPKKFIGIHNARARIDSERIYGGPSRFKDWRLKQYSKILGKVFNLRISRPNKGKIIRGSNFSRKDLK